LGSNGKQQHSNTAKSLRSQRQEQAWQARLRETCKNSHFLQSPNFSTENSAAQFSLGLQFAGSAQTTPTVRKSSLPPSKKVAATGSSPAAAPKPSKPAESIGKAPVENGSASKSVKKPKAASGPVAAKGGDTGASKKAANGNGAAAAAAVARLTTVPEQDNARDASTNDFVMVRIVTRRQIFCSKNHTI
jgi:hypothetical protein